MAETTHPRKTTEKTTSNVDFLCSFGRHVVQAEAAAIEALNDRIDASFAQACQLILKTEGRVVVTGMGKSGHIGKKIAATLASTGTPAFFVHPGEASHGDLGMITQSDCVLAISNSGETDEICTILPIIKRLKIPLITFTGKSSSTLAKAANANLDIGVSEEACPLNLAPTSSTTTTLVMGDALAVALLEARGFTKDDFAFSHPAGRLGKRLLIRVEDIMHSGQQVPSVSHKAKAKDALIEMTEKGLGMTAVVDENHSVQGIFTDGDLRRALENNIDIHTTSIQEIMTSSSKTIQAHVLAVEALQYLETHKINGLLVTDEHNKLVGAFNMHDLLRAGVV